MTRDVSWKKILDIILVDNKCIVENNSSKTLKVTFFVFYSLLQKGTLVNICLLNSQDLYEPDFLFRNGRK